MKQIQIDEPLLVTDLNAEEKQAFKDAYQELSDKTNLEVTIATYFGGLEDNLNATALPVKALHSLVRAPEQLDAVLNVLPEDRRFLGLIDGRNIWKTNLKPRR